jgi:hypothetical protein
MSCHTFDAEYLLEQYELLRREAIEISPHTQRGRGMLLFLTRGMVAWIEAASCLSGRRAAPMEVTTQTLPFSFQPEITAVLANMVLVCMQEVHE